MVIFSKYAYTNTYIGLKKKQFSNRLCHSVTVHEMSYLLGVKGVGALRTSITCCNIDVVRYITICRSPIYICMKNDI